MLLPELIHQLTKLKSIDLKSIAQLCGSATSGTKLVLASALARTVHERTQRAAETYRIISVDLGIDNIGVCQISAPPVFNSLNTNGKPVVERWFHHKFPAPFSHQYPWFSDTAIDVCRTIAAGNQPDAIVFEKQRSRTAGSSSIPDAVLRVNVLEGMAFTAFRLSNPQTLLQSVNPRKIVEFWRLCTSLSPTFTSNRGSKTKLTSSQMYKEAKLVRRRLVDRWQTAIEDSPLTFTKKFDHSDLKKHDDVNDALVQGYTWLIWRRNCAQLVANFENSLPLNTELKQPESHVLN